MVKLLKVKYMLNSNNLWFDSKKIILRALFSTFLVAAKRANYFIQPKRLFHCGILLLSDSKAGDGINVVVEGPPYVVSFVSNSKEISVIFSASWEINMTQLSKQFNKLWREWRKRHAAVIDTFEKLEGRELIRVTGPKNKPQAFLSLPLALRVLSDYDPILSYQIFKRYSSELCSKNNELIEELALYRDKLELATATIAKLEKKRVSAFLTGGRSYLYAYACNSMTKSGTSYSNVNGQRLKSHRSSVPNLVVGFVVYAAKKHLQALQKAIKAKFNPLGSLEHLNVDVSTLETFVYWFLDGMQFPYTKESSHTLNLLNIFFKG